VRYFIHDIILVLDIYSRAKHCMCLYVYMPLHVLDKRPLGSGKQGWSLSVTAGHGAFQFMAHTNNFISLLSSDAIQEAEMPKKKEAPLYTLGMHSCTS